MNMRIAVPLILLVALAGGCADMGGLGGTTYGESSGTTAGQSDRYGTITHLENVQVDDKYKLGVGTAAGAVAGGILGSQVGDSTTATVAGAVLGGLAGTYAESKYKKQDAQKVTVNMNTGGSVTILQPVDGRLRNGMHVRVEGSGENARVVPR
ncbi:MAG: glycine zipper 2TM domain-containing protein [Burkholderiales bacterium]|nr:glycine zipper 2TM domain-containing protein [Burkholderiales bacterium]